MISSMTAFARSQRQGEWGSLVCEMRSINHRYLEISLHVPEMLRPLEMSIRECIREHIKRGKIECSIRSHVNQTTTGVMFNVNTVLAKELCLAAEQIGTLMREPQKINPMDVMRFPGVMETKESNLEVLEDDVLALIEQTIKELAEARQREGEELNRLFTQRLDLMQVELVKVRTRLPQVMIDQQERLLKRFHDAKIELEPARLEQEMVMYAQKIDVTEEMDRTDTHINEVRRMLKHGGIVGRRFDFLLQELNREANTLGSKSVDPEVTHAAVEMKVLIEQIREQAQNIE